MNNKSDTSAARRVSATDASRSFSDLLDQIEGGRTFIVQRHGRDVCVMTAPPPAGRTASECLLLLRGRPPVLLDDNFGNDLMDVITTERKEERPSWDS
jgi:antitoxin (DNA-binding transcriptional repressor) of toxin-antitoxin stability system